MKSDTLCRKRLDPIKDSDILCRKNHRPEWNPTFYVGKTTVKNGIRHSMSEKPRQPWNPTFYVGKATVNNKIRHSSWKRLDPIKESDILCRKNYCQQWNPTFDVGTPPSTIEFDIRCRKNHRPERNPTFYVGDMTVINGIRHSMSEKATVNNEIWHSSWKRLDPIKDSDILCRKKQLSTMESDILCRKNHRQQWNPTL